MLDTVKNPVSDTLSYWGKTVEKVVGKGNYSMDRSKTLASNKTAYARLYMLGNPTSRSDLEGNECATTPSFQVDSFASGTKPLTKVYKIDDASHKAMVDMGYRRTYGPELMENADGSIKRVVSRYSRVYAGKLLNE